MGANKGWVIPKYYKHKKTGVLVLSSYYLQYYDESGKTISRSLKTKKKTVASDELAKFRIGLLNNRPDVPGLSAFGKECLEYGVGQKLSKSTLWHYEFVFRKLLEFTEVYKSTVVLRGNIKLEKINSKLLQDFINWISADYSSGTVNIVIRNLKHLFSLAVSWEYMKNNPCVALNELLQMKNKRLHFTDSQWNYILDNIERVLFVKSENGKEKKIISPGVFKDMLIVLYDMGFRLDELCHLQYSDFIELEGVRGFMVSNKWNFNPKRKKERFIPLTDRVCEIIARSVPSIDGYIFGRKYSKRYISKLFRDLLDELGFEKYIYCIHSIRHSFITRLHKEGVELKTGSMLMGHSRVQTTEGYLNTTLQDKVRAMSLLNKKTITEA